MMLTIVLNYKASEIKYLLSNLMTQFRINLKVHNFIIQNKAKLLEKKKQQ